MNILATKIKEIFKEHRDLILMWLFFIVGSLLLIWIANLETDAKQTFNHESTEASKMLCKKISKITAERNITRDNSISTDELRQDRIACSNYLKYLYTTDDSMLNIGDETMNTERAISNLDEIIKDRGGK